MTSFIKSRSRRCRHNVYRVSQVDERRFYRDCSCHRSVTCMYVCKNMNSLGQLHFGSYGRVMEMMGYSSGHCIYLNVKDNDDVLSP